jgi:hypothetical protein
MMRIRRGSCTLDPSMTHSAPGLRGIKWRFFPQFVVRSTGNAPGRDDRHAPLVP